MELTVQYLTLALQLIPQLVAAGEDVGQFVADVTSNTSPTQADLDALHAKEATLRASLDANG